MLSYIISSHALFGFSFYNHPCLTNVASKNNKKEIATVFSVPT